MDICNGKGLIEHKEIVYEESPCPLCWALEVISYYKKDIKKLEKGLKELKGGEDDRRSNP